MAKKPKEVLIEAYNQLFEKGCFKESDKFSKNIVSTNCLIKNVSYFFIIISKGSDLDVAIEKKVEDLSISANKTEKVVDDGPPKFKIRTLKKGSSTGTKPKKERI